MPTPKGVRLGGRKKGTPNKSTATLKERMDRLKCDPFTVLARIANGELACGVCHGKGKTRYQSAEGADRTLERLCQSCYGSKLERISPAERGKAAAELAQYLEAKRKAIEHSGTEGGPIQARVEVVFVKPTL